MQCFHRCLWFWSGGGDKGTLSRSPCLGGGGGSHGPILSLLPDYVWSSMSKNRGSWSVLPRNVLRLVHTEGLRLRHDIMVTFLEFLEICLGLGQKGFLCRSKINWCWTPKLRRKLHWYWYHDFREWLPTHSLQEWLLKSVISIFGIVWGQTRR